MDLFDLIIIILLIAMVVRGAQTGLIRQIFADIGFIGGIFIGALLTPHLLNHSSNAQSRSIWTLVFTLGLGVVFLGIGEYIGVLIKQKVMKFKVNKLDSGFGAVLAILTFLVTIWLASSILLKLPYQGLQSEIQQSAIVSELDRHLPPAPNAVAHLGHLIAPNGFPIVFIGNEPPPSTPVTLPSNSSFTSVVRKDSASVVQVAGDGCGGIVEGSGFIASDNLVITNAHVVAGVAQPYVIDGNGKHPAEVIWFDPNLDLAVLKTSNLVGQPLTMDASVKQHGTLGEVMGYPGGGPLKAVGAAVLDSFVATGRNIYNEGSTNRDIYELQATVIPGNSGGPVIEANGDVFGIVFAQSTVYNHVGYALTMNQVISEFNQAKNQDNPTQTGTCAE